MKPYSISLLEQGRIIKKAEARANRILNERLNELAERLVREHIDDEYLPKAQQSSFEEALLDWLKKNGN